MTYCIPDISSRASLKLDHSLRIGRGNKRDCYRHPDDVGLCIKVPRHQERQEECQQQSIVEWHYIKHLKDRQVPLTHLIDCYGWVETPFGPGIVMQRVRDGDGRSAPTLREAMQGQRISRDRVLAMLDDLRTWALHYAVVIADLNAANLMIQPGDSDGPERLVLVDGFGSRKPDWKFSMYQRSMLLARLKSRRQWQRQETSLMQEVAQL